MTILPATDWQPGKPGIYSGLPESEYRKAPGVNISSLKALRRSPAHYKHALTEEDQESSALVVGTLVHQARLEPQNLSYVVRPAEFTDWRTKAAKEWRDAQKLPVITPDEEEVVLRCAQALREVPLIEQMARAGHRELTCFKRHERTGLLLKGRADLVSLDASGHRWGCDIKTVIEGMAARSQFERRVSEYDYHLQAAYYMDLFDLHHFIFIAVEKEGYPGVGPYELDAESIRLARRTNEAFLQTLAECQSSNSWPSYPREIREIGLTAWKRTIESEDVK